MVGPDDLHSCILLFKGEQDWSQYADVRRPELETYSSLDELNVKIKVFLHSERGEKFRRRLNTLNVDLDVGRLV